MPVKNCACDYASRLAKKEPVCLAIMQNQTSLTCSSAINSLAHVLQKTTKGRFRLRSRQIKIEKSGNREIRR
jgi:hypothetical protein